MKPEHFDELATALGNAAADFVGKYPERKDEAMFAVVYASVELALRSAESLDAFHLVEPPGAARLVESALKSRLSARTITMMAE